ncbi:hypothetical protein SAMN04489860_2570 [Paraoerskovia marina]|uniref:DUF6318 domain-containing protein n=1 Tax=Paraoerskovia marina TaxID=545619 RepID=A0A1H1VPA2_9CELL|nr:DUF6318 family protein [Paraoerskovia marina]SDS86707.1 hypothetical protein SAMN04489860_2570 [Paraoerskovia marina]
MRVRRRTLALALPVALVLGLGGCTSDDEPEPGASATTTTAPTAPAPETPEPTESPKPEPTATGPTPPPRPAAMDDTGKKGAQAAAEYFMLVMNYTFRSGDTSEIIAISYETCATCDYVVANSSEYASKGWLVDGGAVELMDVEVSEKDELTGAFGVTARFESEEMLVLDKDGEVAENFDADTGYLQFDTMHDGEDWRAVGMISDQGEAE